VLDQAVSPEAILAAATFFARVIHEDIAHRGLTLGRLGAVLASARSLEHLAGLVGTAAASDAWAAACKKP
jgi:hypothetical protein